MKIDHVAIWAKDLEKLKEFYTRYFNAVSGERYYNPHRKFESYFLTFTSGAKLELMKTPDLIQLSEERSWFGFAHMAISVGSAESVDKLTDQLRNDGYSIVGEPRTTGDGYYESVVLDPDGNRVEITV